MIVHWPNTAGEMADRIRTHEWEATPLGPIDTWPQALITAVGILLALNEPTALAWGPELIILYNDAYVRFFGGREQVAALGMGVPAARPELWSMIGPDYEQVLRGGLPVRYENRLVPVLRHGRMEDIYWTYSFNPVPDAGSANGVGGVLIVAVEGVETKSVMQASDDRQLFLSKLSDTLRPLVNPDVIRMETCRLLGEQLAADWVVYGLIDVPRDIVDIDRGYMPNGQPPVTGKQPLSAFGWALASYKAGITVVVSDTQTSDQIPAAERPAIAAIRMTALISVPLLKNGALVGALALSQERPRTWTRAEVRLVEETAERIWDAIERARSEAALRESRSHLQVLVHELQHRTRNLMAVVRATASKTLKTSSDLVDFKARFESRIDALARAQGLLSRMEDNGRVTFDELVRTELNAMGAPEDAVILDGPSGVRLRSHTVQVLSMALHELATNALKYGALRQRGARLSIRWWMDQEEGSSRPLLHIDWKEIGVPIADQGSIPRRRGQGSDLIERALPYQLKAVTSLEFSGDGVHCTIVLPVSAGNEEDTSNE